MSIRTCICGAACFSSQAETTRRSTSTAQIRIRLRTPSDAASHERSFRSARHPFVRSGERKGTTRKETMAACTGQLSFRASVAPARLNRSEAKLPRRNGVGKDVTVMGNPGAGGPFAPIVVLTRNVMGKKEFNQFRGKAIALHSQVIKSFCKEIGADTKQVQGLIRLAKKNGEKLGFLA